MVNTQANKVKEPLFHIVKRSAMPFKKVAAIRVSSVLLATILCSLMSTILIGKNPFEIFGVFVKGLFVDPWTLLQDTALLLAFGVAIVPAFKMKYWNMGANGQVLMGCLAAIYCMLNFSDKLPDAVTILLMLVSAIVFSVVWAVIPAIFKALFNTNETLFTLMMNYIAIGLVNAHNYNQTRYTKVTIGIVNQFTKKAWLPNLGNAYVLPILIIALVTAFVYVYMKYSKHGYEISVVGESENTAQYVGISVKKVVVRTMALSGVICGIIGFLYAAAIGHSVSSTTATLGFTAILIAWLGKFNPLVMIGTSFFVVAMKAGTGQINMSFSLGSNFFADIITGIVFFFIIGSEFFIAYSLKGNEKVKRFFAKIKGIFKKKKAEKSEVSAAENVVESVSEGAHENADSEQNENVVEQVETEENEK